MEIAIECIIIVKRPEKKTQRSSTTHTTLFNPKDRTVVQKERQVHSKTLLKVLHIRWNLKVKLQI